MSELSLYQHLNKKLFVLMKIITCISSAGVPQTPIHLKPQLARSASKTRGIRAPELGDPRKGDMQSSGIDILETTPTRPPQLAPVKVSFSTCYHIHCLSVTRMASVSLFLGYKNQNRKKLVLVKLLCNLFTRK